jgi:hypothetical protein
MFANANTTTTTLTRLQLVKLGIALYEVQSAAYELCPNITSDAIAIVRFATRDQLYDAADHAGLSADNVADIRAGIMAGHVSDWCDFAQAELEAWS